MTRATNRKSAAQIAHKGDGRLSTTDVAARYGLSHEQLVQGWVKAGKLDAETVIRGDRQIFRIDPIDVATFFLSDRAGKNQLTVQDVAISDISLDVQFWVRRRPISPNLVGGLRDVVTESNPQPIVLVRTPTRLLPADGWLRLLACRAAGIQRYPAYVVPGSEADAFLLGGRLNMSHGVQLTPDDKRAILHEKIRQQPDLAGRTRALARATGIPRQTVSRLLQSPAPSPTQQHSPELIAEPRMLPTCAQLAAVTDLAAEGPPCPTTVAADLATLINELPRSRQRFRRALNEAIQILTSISHENA